MKKHKATYSERETTFWPYYEAGMVGFIGVIVVCVPFIVATSWFLMTGRYSDTTGFVLAVMILPAVVAVFLVCRFFSKQLFTQISVTDIGVSYSNGRTRTRRLYRWEEIRYVSLYKENWFGSEACWIILKDSAREQTSTSNNLALLFAINGVDRKKVMQFVPSNLRKDMPWSELKKIGKRRLIGLE